jgi:cell wall-associated NlpC family hydrolase
MPTDNFITFNEFNPTVAISIPIDSGIGQGADYSTMLRNRSMQRLDDNDFALSNPSFDTRAAGRIANSLAERTRSDVRILRGYIRRSAINGTDPTSKYRLYFMFNPETLQRDFVSYLDQQALDPFNTVFGANNLVAPPGVLDFSFDLYFDRQTENANGRMPRGVLEDFDYFNLVVRGVVPDSQTPDLPDNGVLMINPRNITVVFSPQISIQGRPQSALVSYEKFDHRMRPIRMKITISVKAYYIGPVRQDFTFASTGSAGRVEAVVPYNETFKVRAVAEESRAAKKEGTESATEGFTRKKDPQGKQDEWGNPFSAPLPTGGAATGQGLLDAAATFLGERYNQGPQRCSPTSGYKDCSGLIVASFAVATGGNLGATVSSSIWKLCADAGLGISRADAFNIPGACLLMPDDPMKGAGNDGHIGFSDGNGGTIEATGSSVQKLPNNYQRWGKEACLLPFIAYSRSK